MRFKNYVNLIFLVSFTLQSSLALTPEERPGSYNKDGYPMDTAAMRHVTSSEYTQVKAQLDQTLNELRACKALQPALIANLDKSEKAFAAYQIAMQDLYYPTYESKQGSIYSQQSTYLNTRMIKQHIELITSVYKGDQRAEWCGK